MGGTLGAIVAHWKILRKRWMYATKFSVTEITIPKGGFRRILELKGEGCIIHAYGKTDSIYVGFRIITDKYDTLEKLTVAALRAAGWTEPSDYIYTRTYDNYHTIAFARELPFDERVEVLFFNKDRTADHKVLDYDIFWAQVI